MLCGFLKNVLNANKYVSNSAVRENSDVFKYTVTQVSTVTQWICRLLIYCWDYRVLNMLLNVTDLVIFGITEILFQLKKGNVYKIYLNQSNVQVVWILMKVCIIFYGSVIKQSKSEIYFWMIWQTDKKLYKIIKMGTNTVHIWVIKDKTKMDLHVYTTSSFVKSLYSFKQSTTSTCTCLILSCTYPKYPRSS